MIATAALGLRRRDLAWRHPEAVAAGVAAAAWLGLLLALAGPEELRRLHAAAHRDAPLLAGAVSWMLMCVAMMVPAALPVARGHALRALWDRRRRTVALFFAGQLGVWALFGAAAAVALAVAGGEPRVLLACVLAVAAAWELTPAKWRAVRSCHLSAPLPPHGARADAACVRAGAVYGRRCVASCWPAMLAMAIAGHAAIVLMVVLTAAICAEKLLARPARIAVPVTAVFSGEALIALIA